MNSVPSVSPRLIPARDGVLTWCGVIEVEHTPAWSRGWRLPRARREFFPSERLLVQARAQAGVRVVFGTDTVALGGRCVSTDATARILRAYGDADVHLVDGLDVLGADQGHLLSAGLHPNADGYAHMAAEITSRVGRLLETASR